MLLCSVVLCVAFVCVVPGVDAVPGGGVVHGECSVMVW